MNFYDNPDNVSEYISMCKEYNGDLIYTELRSLLKDNTKGLELGSGPGIDISYLKKLYKMTGSDYSKEFIKRLSQKHKDIEFLHIDAKELAIDRNFDFIFSNKVLYHLTKNELIKSLNAQYNIVNPEGYIIHTFWNGEGSESAEGLHFQYYTTQELEELFSKKFKVIKTLLYKEMDDSDSILIVGKKY